MKYGAYWREDQDCKIYARRESGRNAINTEMQNEISGQSLQTQTNSGAVKLVMLTSVIARSIDMET